ncbi:hypothetical protein ACMGD3_23835 [Lysinibacillus sphaericus]|uniref:hypothetical protein n=1 Tax=Lysinibacillus sphaericus TaxID=1421 RepID=UPI003F7A482B
MTTVNTSNDIPKSDYSSENTEVQWKIIESRVEPNKNITLSTLSPKQRDLLNALSVVGVMGSAQMKDIFFKKNKKHISMAKDFGLVEQHTLIRNGRAIPIFTLGVTGVALQKQLGGTKPLNYWQNFTVDDAMKCIVTYQLFGRYRQISDTYLEDISRFTPFQAQFASPFAKGVSTYSVGALRNVNDIAAFETYLRIGQDIPQRMIFIVTNLDLIDRLQSVLKPYLKYVRVVVDVDLKQSMEFKNMFYAFNEQVQQWGK